MFFFTGKWRQTSIAAVLDEIPNVKNCSRSVLIVQCMHCWASASRPMPPAVRYRSIPVSTFLSIPVPEWSDARQSGIPSLIKTYTLHVHTASWKEYHGRLVTKKSKDLWCSQFTVYVLAWTYITTPATCALSPSVDAGGGGRGKMVGRGKIGSVLSAQPGGRNLFNCLCCPVCIC